MVKVCVLASSSSGNATFVGTERTRLLVDAGLSRREMFRRLAEVGEDPEKLTAVLITHEHTDHVCGLLPILRKLRIPVYMTGPTAASIRWGDFETPIERFTAGSRFQIGDIEVNAFTIPHDAIDPVGYTFRAEGVKVGVVTDLGYVPDSIKWHLRGSDLLLIESNHDLEMLRVGPYPWPVKQRVMGRRGHLSNDVVCDFIREGLDGSTSTLLLGHLSEHNNHPELVRSSAQRALDGRGLGSRLVVLDSNKPTEVFLH